MYIPRLLLFDIGTMNLTKTNLVCMRVQIFLFKCSNYFSIVEITFEIIWTSLGNCNLLPNTNSENMLILIGKTINMLYKS